MSAVRSELELQLRCQTVLGFDVGRRGSSSSRWSRSLFNHDTQGGQSLQLVVVPKSAMEQTFTSMTAVDEVPSGDSQADNPSLRQVDHRVYSGRQSFMFVRCMA